MTREDAANLNVSGGSLNIMSQNFDIHGGATGLRNIVHQPLPTSGPWTATIRANWDPTTNYNNAGLMVYDADERFIKAGMVWSGGRKFEAFKELDNTATALGSATATLPAAFPATWYLRLQSDGTTIQPAYSADGITWTNYGATTNLSGFTAPKIGVYATSASSTNRELKVDWFKLTTPQDAERRVRRELAEPVPLERHRAPRAGRLHGRRREAHAAGGAWRLLPERRQHQPEHPAAAGPVRALDDVHEAHVRPERELRAGRSAGLRRRQQLRQGRLRLQQRTRARVPARDGGHRGGLRRQRRTSPPSRPRSSCGSSPTARRCGRTTASTATRRGHRSANRRRCRAWAPIRRSVSTPTTATPR